MATTPATATGAPAGPNRRRVLGYGAAGLVGLVPALAGCGTSSSKTSSSSSSAKELTFWNFYGPSPRPSPQSDWFVNTVAAWNKDHDVKVKLRYVPNADYVNGNTLQTAFASGSGPDIFLLSSGDFLRYYNGKVLHDLTSAVPADVRKDYVSGVLDTRTVDGKLYGLPMEIEPLAMYYNQQAFEAAHLSEADLPKTWDQLLQVGQKLTSGNKFGVLFETAPGYYQNFTWYPFMWQGHGLAVGPDKKSAFDSTAVQQALAFWQQTQKMGIAPKKPLGTGANDAPSNAGSGYVAMQQTGIWSVADMAQQKPKVKYDIFPLPTPPGGRPATDGGGWAFAANAKGRDPETAAKFIAWALGSAGADSIERGRQWNTVAKSNLPPRAAVQKAAEAHGAFTSGVLKKWAQLVVPSAEPEPRYPPEVYKAISDAIQSTQLAGADPATAAATAASTINTFLSGYSGGAIL